MTQTSSSPQVLFRPAIESDYTDIAEFCKGIWDGGVYVPKVWHHWLKDPQGLLATAEYNGHAIGCSKLTLLAEGQWWLEGFRVDPQHQGLKVGSRIHDYVTDWWQEHCDGTLRLMTSAKNVHVHHLCERTGYVKTHEVCGYESSPLDESLETILILLMHKSETRRSRSLIFLRAPLPADLLSVGESGEGEMTRSGHANPWNSWSNHRDGRPARAHPAGNARAAGGDPAGEPEYAS